ncbi:hypothetical protein [Pandoraea communis]|uniref:hypothetical protein n=1 Tax=Pandoraea communis TaxID=2508297 RepID=UPI0025A5C87B|nr:hypothetical protein [Pandoraea communis]MDM8359315.1 hypothetical protein [Pandoraea communis]
MNFAEASEAPSANCDDALTFIATKAPSVSKAARKSVRATVAERSAPDYFIRLFLPSNSPENLDGYVTIGWLKLDADADKIFDVTIDPDEPKELEISTRYVRNFVRQCLISTQPISQINCDEIRKVAEHGNYIAAGSSRRTVIGAGRLQFYSAPDYSCKMPRVFVLTGESVIAYANYLGFTSVAYIRSKGAGPVLGWVRSDRLRPNGLGVSPRPPQDK